MLVSVVHVVFSNLLMKCHEPESIWVVKLILRINNVHVEVEFAVRILTEELAQRTGFVFVFVLVSGQRHLFHVDTHPWSVLCFCFSSKILVWLHFSWFRRKELALESEDNSFSPNFILGQISFCSNCLNNHTRVQHGGKAYAIVYFSSNDVRYKFLHNFNLRIVGRNRKHLRKHLNTHRLIAVISN